MNDDATRIDFELEIADAASGTRACVAPNRGGMVTTLDVAARPVFFLDQGTLGDPKKNVRGGSPVLFPTPGRLTGGTWSRDRRTGALEQHGFARNLPWTIAERGHDAVTLRLEADATTRAAYPWDFTVELEHRVSARGLFSEARVANHSGDSMPFGFGFHPYFVVADKTTFSLTSGASRAFDNAGKREVPFDPRTLVLGATEIDLHLLDHGEPSLSFAVDATRVTLAGSPEYTHWVLWSLPGRDFVCVEPWTCPGDAMNTGERLIRLGPGESRVLTLEIRVEPR